MTRFFSLCLCTLLFSLSLSVIVDASPITIQIPQASKNDKPTAYGNGFGSPQWKELLEKIKLQEGEVYLMWRGATPQKVEEYVKAGTLTAIEATSDTIGPGAYGAPFGARFPALREQVESRSETIIVIGNKAKILQAPKLYLPDPKNLHMGWETKDRLEYIKKKGMDPKTTLLFNSHYHWRNAYQLVIPPHYLIKSDLYPKEEYGTNSLGLRVVQVPTQDIPKQLGQLEASGLPACEWDTLGVRDWPADVKLSTAEGREKVLRDGWLRSNIW